MMKNTDIWIGAYLQQMLLSSFGRRTDNLHVLFCFVDHFEPLWNCAQNEVAWERVSRWIRGYEAEAPKYSDSDGRCPRHTYFYPIEQYRDDFLNEIAGHCRKGFGEAEIHLHHDNDSGENLRLTLEEGVRLISKHGLLGIDSSGRIRYGFVHGDWALDNSHPDGRFCGVNNELTILRDTGCYADFTLPSAPSETQTTTINSIYYAVDDPRRPKSHNSGVRVKAGAREPEGNNHLMIIQGPLMLNWNNRIRGLLPRIENGEISGANTPNPYRLKLWIQAGISVAGKRDWVFVKVHTHGCTDSSYDSLFKRGGFQKLHSALRKLSAEKGTITYHYVTARELYNIIKAAEAGERGSPFDFRDYLIKARTCE